MPRTKSDELIPKPSPKKKIELDRFKFAVENFVELVEGLMLAVVSIFAMWASYYQYGLNHWTEYALFASGAGMALQAFYLLGKHFAKRSR